MTSSRHALPFGRRAVRLAVVAAVVAAPLMAAPVAAQSPPSVGEANGGPTRSAYIPVEPLVEVDGFAPWLVRSLDREVLEGIRAGATPGLAVVVGHRGRVVLNRSWGRMDWGPESPRITTHAVWDLASVTKVMATTLAVMALVEDGLVDLDAPLWNYLPAWPATGPRADVSFRELLTHRAGFPAGAPIWRFGSTRTEQILGAAALPIERGRWGEEELYTDIGPILAGWAVEWVTGETLDAFVQRRIYSRLGLWRTGFEPLEHGVPLDRIVPTQRTRDGLIRGVVHDPTARRLGGVAGNAGLFSTAGELGRLASAILWEDPARVVCRDIVRDFQAREHEGRRFGAGFERPAHWSYWSEVLSDQAFGHTGFTGTSLWIDPEKDLFVIFLSNRTHGFDRGAYLDLRRDVHDAIGRALLARPSPGVGSGAAEVLPAEGGGTTPPAGAWDGVDSCRVEAGVAAVRRLPPSAFHF